jgi:hypothetical protein
VAQAFQKADKRIQQQRDLATVQLSSFGKLKSAFADDSERLYRARKHQTGEQ